jgi:hypothetical protein
MENAEVGMSEVWRNRRCNLTHEADSSNPAAEQLLGNAEFANVQQRWNDPSSGRRRIPRTDGIGHAIVIDPIAVLVS